MGDRWELTASWGRTGCEKARGRRSLLPGRPRLGGSLACARSQVAEQERAGADVSVPAAERAVPGQSWGWRAMAGEGGPSGRGAGTLAVRASLSQTRRGAPHPEGPLQDGGREKGHRGGDWVIPRPWAKPRKGEGPTFPAWFVFLQRLVWPSFAVWLGGCAFEYLWCHSTYFSPHVSRCHRGGGLVPGVRLWSPSPLQPDRIWLPSLHLVSGSPCNYLPPFLSPSPIQGCPSYCTPSFPERTV